MYLCVCNAITEDQVAWAVRERGADSVEAVRAGFQRPQRARSGELVIERGNDATVHEQRQSG